MITLKVYPVTGNAFHKVVEDSCVNWESSCYEFEGTIVETVPSNSIPKFALCEGRHVIHGVTVSIFGNSVDPKNLRSLQVTAMKKLQAYSGQYVQIYVTGLTVTLIETLKVCRDLNIEITLMHYDKDTGDYYPQEV